MQFLASIRRTHIYWGIASIALIALGAYVFYPRAAERDVFIVEAGEFVQEVSASGRVVPSRDVALGFTQGGRIASVSARVGQTALAGSVLARLDGGELNAVLLQRQAALESQKAKLEALLQGPRPEEIAVAEAQVESARVSLSQTNAALLDEIRDAYAVAETAVRSDLYQFVSNPRSSNPQLNFTVTDSQAASDFLAGLASMEARLVAWQQDLLSLSSESATEAAVTAQTNLSAVTALLSKGSAVLSRSQPNQSVSSSDIAAYAADVSAARSSVNAGIAALTSATTADKSAATALSSAQRNLDLKRLGAVQADIDAQMALVRGAEADVENVRSQIAKTVIVAPFTGTVSVVDAKAGAIASPNTPLISLIAAGAYQIESFIPEVSIALLKAGDSARVTLDAYGENVHFTASVVSIDPAETIKDGVSTYRAVLQFETADERIRSGMTANIVIEAERREGVLSVPQGVVRKRDGASYVSVLVNEAVEEREVTTGDVSSMGRIEILSGLREGDVIPLSAE